VKKKLIILNAVAVLSCIGLLAGGYFLVSNFSRLSKSILPGLHSSPSKSMKPYTIRLRTPDHWGETKERDKVHEWKLALPRAFVDSEFGDPDDLKKTYSVNLNAVFNPNTLEITPATLSKRQVFLDEGVIIDLRNSGTRSKKNKCINDEQYFEDDFHKCKSHHLKCRINTNYMGLTVKIQMVKKYFYKPQKICDAVVAFLENKTINIDDLED